MPVTFIQSSDGYGGPGGAGSGTTTTGANGNAFVQNCTAGNMLIVLFI